MRRKLKFGVAREMAQAAIDRVIERKGKPKTEEEAIEILTEAWGKLVYMVKDGRKGAGR